jgi:hypothetical protein
VAAAEARGGAAVSSDMTSVVFTGWRNGLNRVELDKALRNVAGLRLAEAVCVTEDLLAGGTVVVRVENEQIARELATKANSLGAICFVNGKTAFDVRCSATEGMEKSQEQDS